MNQNSLKTAVKKNTGLMQMMDYLKEILQKNISKSESSQIDDSLGEETNYLNDEDNLKWDEYGNPYI
jgi:hypothetical protein